MNLPFPLDNISERIMQLFLQATFENPRSQLHSAIGDAILSEQVRRAKVKAGEASSAVQLDLPLLSNCHAVRPNACAMSARFRRHISSFRVADDKSSVVEPPVHMSSHVRAGAHKRKVFVARAAADGALSSPVAGDHGSFEPNQVALSTFRSQAQPTRLGSR